LASGAIKLGDYLRAQTYLSQAIERNPNDIGKNYKPMECSAGENASDEDWGKSQLVRMLRDRPTMRQGIEEGDALWKWTSHRFRPRILNARIEWDSKQPKSTTALYYYYRGKAGLNLRIQVNNSYVRGRRKGQDRPFEELWQSIVFELHNIHRSHEFGRLDCSARKRTISKSEYVRARFGLEFLTAQETRAFYLNVFIPWASANKIQLSKSLGDSRRKLCQI